MSLLEELKKNDLYEPYAKKLDQLLKGGPNAVPPNGNTVNYKVAAAKASKASNTAMNQQTFKSHAKASFAHKLASHEADQNKDPKNAEFHAAQAKLHDQAASAK